jgi:2-phospho-L-lactate guanylyltransferase
MRTAAILPVKRFAAAKSRLGASGVGETLRERLAEAMVADVLLALARSAAIELTILVTREPRVFELADEHGALAIDDATESGQSQAVALGVARAMREGFQRALCVPGDCPALDAGELDAMLAAADARVAALGGADVAIVPDRHGTGTNGLLLTPPDAIAPAFGPGSCERHSALALAAGARCQIERPASLLLDVDTGEDLAALRRRLEATGAAAATRALLGQPTGDPNISILQSG